MLTRRRIAGAIVAGAVLALVVAIVLTRGGGSDDDLERARALLDDDAGFTTAFKAGDTLARVGELLRDEGVRCRETAEPAARTARCPQLLEASAAAQVMAVRVLTCTAPGRADGQRRMAAHLDALARGDDPGDPPAPPACDR